MASAIGDRTLLLLLDNFEHLIDAADDVQGLLMACPRLRIMVTSRQLLRRVLKPRQLMERLSGSLDLLKGGRADARQQTLRATIEWSHDLLTAKEKELFASLAVFAGGWTLDAAEHVANADVDTLEGLVDKSLVRVREQGRFWMLETIREYAAEQLDREPNAAQLRRRHAENFVAAAEAETPHLRDDDRHGWMRRLKDDQDNFRRAVAYLEAAEEVEDLAQLLSAVSLVWAPVFEALAWLERALAMLDPQSPVRPRALNAAASLYASQGEPERGAVCAREALDLAQRLGQPIDIAESQWALGFCLVEAGEPDAAPELLRTSVDLFAAAGDLHGAVWAARSRAFALIACGRPEDGRALHEENLARARSIGNRGAEATT